MMETKQDLHNKAYRQGFQAGYNGRKISQADWEKEFLPDYNEGYRDGCEERKAQGK